MKKFNNIIHKQFSGKNYVEELGWITDRKTRETAWDGQNVGCIPDGRIGR